MAEKPTYDELLQRIRALEESQETYRVLVHDSPDLLYRTDLEGRIVFVSSSIQRLSGYTMDEAVGMRMAEEVYLVPEERKRFLDTLRSKGRVENYEARLRRKDGSVWWASTNAHFFTDRNGEVLGVEGITRDISEIKAAEEALKESEKKYRHLFETAMVGIYRTRIEDGSFLAANQTLARMMGYESVDRFVNEYVTSDHYTDPKRREELLRLLRTQGKVDGFEIEMERPDGSTIPIALSATLYPEQGFLEGVIVDMTQRHLAQQAIRDANQRMQTILDSVPAEIYVADMATGEVLFMNRPIKESFGRDCVGETCWQAFRGRDTPCPHCTNAELVNENGEPAGVKIWEGRNPVNGSWYVNYDRAVSWIDGRVVRLQVAMDISERMHSEQELEATRAMLEVAINQSPSGILIADAPDARIRFANPAALHIRGLSGDHLTEIDVSEHSLRWRTLYPDGRPYDPEDLPLSRAVFRGETSRGVEVIIRSDSGEEHLVSANAAPIRDSEGVIRAGILVFHDITDRVRAEAALRESEERFRTLVEESPLGFSLIHNDGRYAYVNPRFQEIFGYTIEDVPTGKEWFAKAYPDEAQRRSVMRTWLQDLKEAGVGQARPRIYIATCKDGSRKEVLFRSVTMGNRDQIVIYEDITERSKLEQQFQQAQKFEAIGTLAGGVAHDFNNLLMGIQGRASLMALELGPSHPQKEHIDAIEEYVVSATNLTRQLLGFARGGKYEINRVDINDLALASAAMFGRTRKEIRIHTKVQGKPLVVEAHKPQIEQVLLNLYVNAWQAMPGGGDLYLETSSVRLDDTICDAHRIVPGRYARISVTDTGIGMDESIQQRIFDPFFTTKEKGRGTGLGLASAYGIIKNHGGMITVASEPGHGTTFDIYLPSSDREAPAEAQPKEEAVQGAGLILLVDDEEMILEVGRAMLEKLGYGVRVAGSGQKALDEIRRTDDEIDLVILDLIMPGMDGGATFDRIRDIRPDIPVLLSSGYAINGQAEDIMHRGCSGFIQKPFSLSALSRKVQAVLAGKPESAGD